MLAWVRVYRRLYEDIQQFSNFHGILADKLTFIKDPKKWYTHYQGSIIRCPETDGERILKLNR